MELFPFDRALACFLQSLIGMYIYVTASFHGQPARILLYGIYHLLQHSSLSPPDKRFVNPSCQCTSPGCLLPVDSLHLRLTQRNDLLRFHSEEIVGRIAVIPTAIFFIFRHIESILYDTFTCTLLLMKRNPIIINQRQNDLLSVQLHFSRCAFYSPSAGCAGM